MKFRYDGDSPHGPFEMYGATWENGSVNEISDPLAVVKLKGNAFFSEVDDGAETPAREEQPYVEQRRKPGRPKKIVEIEAEDDGQEPV